MCPMPKPLPPRLAQLYEQLTSARLAQLGD